MFKHLKHISYTLLIVLIVDLLASSGDMTFTWSSPIIPKLHSGDPSKNPLGDPISEDEESWIGSLLNIGAMIGPIPYGFISNHFGRKKALIAVAIPHIISYVTLAFAQTIPLYYAARVLGGMAVGGGYTVLPMYIAEVAEDSNRGSLSVTLNIFWTLGNLIPYCLGPYIPIFGFNLAIACLPITFLILFLLFAPETPYFLLAKNREVEAEKSLMKLRSRPNGKLVEAEMNHIKDVLQHDETGHFLDLFKSKIYLKALGISLVLIIAQQMSGIQAVLGYTETIFESTGSNIPPDISSIIIGSVLFCSSFITPFIVDKSGRKILLLISSIGMTISCITFGLYFFLKDRTDIDTSNLGWLPITSLVFYIIMFNFGVSPLPWTISSELFPNSVKSFAASIVSAVCWTTGFIVMKFFNDLNRGLGRGETFWLFAGFCLLTFVFTLFFVPETKGKSFKEIQMMLDS